MAIKYGFENQYFNYNHCPKCEGMNDVREEDGIGGCVMECSTKCRECGHKAYWAHGIFMGKN